MTYVLYAIVLIVFLAGSYLTVVSMLTHGEGEDRDTDEQH